MTSSAPNPVRVNGSGKGTAYREFDRSPAVAMPGQVKASAMPRALAFTATPQNAD